MRIIKTIVIIQAIFIFCSCNKNEKNDPPAPSILFERLEDYCTKSTKETGDFSYDKSPYIIEVPTHLNLKKWFLIARYTVQGSAVYRVNTERMDETLLINLQGEYVSQLNVNQNGQILILIKNPHDRTLKLYNQEGILTNQLVFDGPDSILTQATWFNRSDTISLSYKQNGSNFYDHFFMLPKGQIILNRTRLSGDYILGTAMGIIYSVNQCDDGSGAVFRCTELIAQNEKDTNYKVLHRIYNPNSKLEWNADGKHIINASKNEVKEYDIPLFQLSRTFSFCTDLENAGWLSVDLNSYFALLKGKNRLSNSTRLIELSDVGLEEVCIWSN